MQQTVHVAPFKVLGGGATLQYIDQKKKDTKKKKTIKSIVPNYPPVLLYLRSRTKIKFIFTLYIFHFCTCI